MAEKTEIEAVMDALNGGSIGSEFDPAATHQFAAVPEGYTIQSLAAYQQRPNRVKAKVYFATVGALAAYLNRFGSEDTVIFADEAKRIFGAVIDYHQAADAGGSAAHAEHSAHMRAEFSDEYLPWHNVSGQAALQPEFIGFLEEHAAVITTPDPATVMEAILNFQNVRTASFKSAKRLQDGTVQFAYEEEDHSVGSVRLPEAIWITAPIFKGGDPITVKVFLRYRLRDGVLHFIAKIDQIERVEREAFGALQTQLEAALTRDDIPIYSAVLS